MNEIQTQINALSKQIDSLMASSTIPKSFQGAVKSRFDFQHIPTVVIGIVAPSITNIPRKIGDLYINTVLGKIYCATGNSVFTDYKLLN